MARYPIPAGLHRIEVVVERSRFLCTLAPASTPEEAHAVVRGVAAEMPDAHHHCWAFVVGAPGSTDRIGSNDDGEPRGTAGRPMLVALLHSEVGDVVAVVTRYFGGVKLGTGGLARAYGGAVQSALASLALGEHMDRTPCTLTVSYPQLDAVQALLQQFECGVAGQRFDVAVHLDLLVPTDRLPVLQSALTDATRGGAALRLPEPPPHA